MKKKRKRENEREKERERKRTRETIWREREGERGRGREGERGRGGLASKHIKTGEAEWRERRCKVVDAACSCCSSCIPFFSSAHHLYVLTQTFFGQKTKRDLASIREMIDLDGILDWVHVNIV